MTIGAIQEEVERLEEEDRQRGLLAGGGATAAIVSIASAATLVECLLAWMLWVEVRPLWLAPLIHLVTFAAVGYCAWRIRPNGSPSRVFVLTVVSLLFFGPLGPLGAMLALLLHFHFRRHATPFEEWYDSLFPERVDEPAQRLYEMLTRGLADSASQEGVTSFTDVLQYGSIEQKRAVISLLSRDFRPEFAPALQSALADKNPAVRVQAATAAANIEGSFLERAIELEKHARQNPLDAEAHFKAARHFDDYAFSGILDGDRQMENRRKAEDYYREVLELDPERGDASLGVGRLLVRQGRLEEAEEWFETGFSVGFMEPAALSWYMEAAFKLGDFDKLRYAVAGFGEEILDHPGVSERLRDVIRLWMGETPDTPQPGEMRLA